MVSTKQNLKIISTLVFLYLALLPFGQIPKLISQFLGVPYFSNIADLLLIGFLVFSIITKRLAILENHKKYKALVSILLFSYLMSSVLFKINSNFVIGGFYLLRFVAYSYFLLELKSLVVLKKNFKKTIVKSLIAAGTCVAVFGFIQYLLFPDLRNLYFLGWDDHYYRLTSTFLDPAFTGIILVFTILLCLSQLNPRNKRWLLILLSVNVIALALTYSRASYLALLVSFPVWLILHYKNLRRVSLGLITFVIVLYFLPRPGGEGVNLLRTKSIMLKLEDYQQSIYLIKSYPLSGVGFNNYCLARSFVFGDKNILSHACSGADNSILFILATTGILGLISFIDIGYAALKNVTKDSYGQTFIITFIATLVHAQFTNTLFYPWVIGWLGMLWAISRDA